MNLRLATTLLAYLCLLAPAFAQDLVPILRIAPNGRTHLMGGLSPEGFLEAEAIGVLPEIERYDLYGPDGYVGEGTAATALEEGPVCPWTRLVAWQGTEPAGVAYALPAAPRRTAAVQEYDPRSEAYLAIVADLLRDQGLEQALPEIRRIVRVDLEGDGVDEVIIVASNHPDEFVLARPGDYSAVFLRRVEAGEVQTLALAFSAQPQEGDSPESALDSLARFRLATLFDVEGDGTLEILIDGFAYETRFAFLLRRQDEGMERVLSWVCGV